MARSINISATAHPSRGLLAFSLALVAVFGANDSAIGTPSLAARSFHSAVWTGSEMILWGGGGNTGEFDDGRRYNPSAKSWANVSLQGAPSARRSHTAVWTGSEMIVWGGIDEINYLSNGARYRPATDSWVSMNPSGLTGRYTHTAVWTGTEMIIWGGYSNGSYQNSGSRYNPVANTWTAVAIPNTVTARRYHTAVWTGTDMIVWGGFNGSYLNTGGRYRPSTASWTTVNTNNAPSARRYHTAVWTGSEMLIWGGAASGGVTLNTGARYNPTANTWTAINTSGAPSARYFHTAVWTGTEMIIWGGYGGGYLNDGARYNPATDTWSPLSLGGAPNARYLHTAVAAGSDMLVWGGYDGSDFVNDGAQYFTAVNKWATLPISAVCQTGFPDDFECRATIFGDSISTVANNVGATKEVNEPNHVGDTGGHSLWWAWTAPYSGGVTLTTAGSEFITRLGVYTGTDVAALTVVTSDGRTNLPGSVTFKATAGVNYKIAVDGHDGATGNILLTLNLRARPANDDYSNRVSIASGGFLAGQNLGATREAVEPNHAGLIGGKSVWWVWTPTSNSCVTITTAGSDFDTMLGVYNVVDILGSLLFIPVASNDDAPGSVTSSVSFNAVAGSYPYAIAVDGYNRAGGNIVLQVLPFVAPPNDNFANAILLTGTNLMVTSSNFCASEEAGEPDHHFNPGGKSLWWRWQAPASGGVTLDLAGTDFSRLLGIYTGASVASLTPVADGFDHEVFKVVGGVQYRIAVDGFYDSSTDTTASGNIVMKLAFSPSPANDDFGNRATLGSTLEDGSNIGATTEVGESSHGQGLSAATLWGKTVWWTWTSQFNGPVSIFTQSSNFVSVVAVYTGSSLTNLTKITARAGHAPINEVPFNAVAGTTYQIAVDGNYSAEGYFTLSAVKNGTPINNNFSSRTVISGTNTFRLGRNTGATRETGEPVHAGITGSNSVWWSWTAPASGRLFLTTIGSSFSPMLAMYQGTNVSNLSIIASNYSSPVCPRFSFVNCDVNTATNPQTFQIAVDGESGNVGGISLAQAFVPRPANDSFSARLPLAGTFLVVTGSVVAATQESGESLAGMSNGLRTVWYSWTAPSNTAGGVTLRITETDVVWTNETPCVGVYQGNTLSALTDVAVQGNIIGNLHQITFPAQAGATYQIQVAGAQITGNGVDTSFTKRLNDLPPDPLSESGSFLLRLNFSPLALRVRNVIPSEVDLLQVNKKVPFGGEAQVINYGAGATGPVRVRLVAIGSEAAVAGDEGSFIPASAGGLAPGGSVSIAISGATPPAGSVLAVLEEKVGDDWFPCDSSIAFAGVGTKHFTCLTIVGGGVVLLEPGLGFGGQCFCPPILTAVQINGPANVNEGSSAAYWGTAFFNNGSTPSFTNTVWTTSNTNKFPITTNGVLTAGSVTANTPISVTSYFSYVGVERSTNKLVTIQNLPPPSVTNFVRLSNGSYQISLQGVPNRQHVVEATTNLSPPINWASLITNAASPSGAFQFTDTQATNFNHRFYRAREN